MSDNGSHREIGRPVHAYDRTLLAKLGFADRDKGDPRHDLACEYLSTDDRLLKLFGISPCGKHLVDLPHCAPCILRVADNGLYMMVAHSQHPVRYVREVRVGEYVEGMKVVEKRLLRRSVHLDVAVEDPVSKGQAQYKTTIGFLDVRAVATQVVRSQVEVSAALYRKHNTWYKNAGVRAVMGVCEVDGEADWGTRLAAEVKIKPVAVGEIVRQIKLYREYVSDHTWAVVTDFDLDAGAIGMLAREGIDHARLGKKFEAWLVARNKTQAGTRRSVREV